MQQLALAHGFDGIRYDFEQAVCFVFQGQQHALREEIIAHQHGYFVFPQGIDGEKAPAFVGVVHHVVMNEGGGVEQFYQRGGRVGFGADFAAELGREEYKHRTHLFAFSSHNVIGDAVEERGGAAHGFPEVALKLFQLLINRALYVVDAFTHAAAVCFFGPKLTNKTNNHRG